MTGHPTMRLFVAVALPPDVVAHLDAHLVIARRRFPELRWVPPERWHLTLTFLGDVDPARVGALDERLARAAGRTTQHRLHLEQGGRFGQRVLWTGVGGQRHLLRRLAERTSAAARRAGLDVEDRPYRPHLTVARAVRPVDLRPAVAQLADYTGPEWPVAAVELVRSTLGAAPRYECLASHGLLPR